MARIHRTFLAWMKMKTSHFKSTWERSETQRTNDTSRPIVTLLTLGPTASLCYRCFTTGFLFYSSVALYLIVVVLSVFRIALALLWVNTLKTVSVLRSAGGTLHILEGIVVQIFLAPDGGSSLYNCNSQAIMLVVSFNLIVPRRHERRMENPCVFVS